MDQNKREFFVFFISFFFFINANANNYLGDNQFLINPELKKHILNSPFKVSIHRYDEKKIMAFLYAEDEESRPLEYNSCIDGKVRNTIEKSGHYYLYLYEPDSDEFIEKRIPVFKSFHKVRMNVEGANFLVLSSTNKLQSDAILLSQHATCNGDQYEAYGYYKNQPHLKKYFFTDKKRIYSFYGRIHKDENGKLIAYSIRNNDGMSNAELFQYKLSLSGKPGEIKLIPYEEN